MAMCKGQTRLRTMSGAPQLGQVTCTGGVGRASRLLWGAPVCEVIICRIVSVVMRQLACMGPKCRTFMNPVGKAMLEEAAQKLKDVEASGA